MVTADLRSPPTPGVRDVIVTVPQGMWVRWLAEGDLPGEEPTGEWDFTAGKNNPREVGAGSRVYVVAFGLLRGYAPLVRTEQVDGRLSFVRGGSAVACTLIHAGKRAEIRGFQGWHYAEATINRARLVPFPDWATAGLPPREAKAVEHVLALRQDPARRAELRRRALAGFPLF